MSEREEGFVNGLTRTDKNMKTKNRARIKDKNKNKEFEGLHVIN